LDIFVLKNLRKSYNQGANILVPHKVEERRTPCTEMEQRHSSTFLAITLLQPRQLKLSKIEK